MELQRPLSKSLNNDITTTATVDDFFVNNEIELLIVMVGVVAFILLIVIVWLGYKLFECDHKSSSSRSSSQTSLYSNSSDSPYQWRSLSTLVAPTNEGMSISSIKQNKTIQRLLDIRGPSDVTKVVSDADAVVVPIVWVCYTVSSGAVKLVLENCWTNEFFCNSINVSGDVDAWRVSIVHNKTDDPPYFRMVLSMWKKSLTFFAYTTRFVLVDDLILERINWAFSIFIVLMIWKSNWYETVLVRLRSGWRLLLPLELTWNYNALHCFRFCRRYEWYMTNDVHKFYMSQCCVG